MNKILIVLLSLLLFSCETEELEAELPIIRYGTSFGKCSGYCITEIQVNPTEAIRVRQGWNNSIVPETLTISFLKSHFVDIESLINTDDFLLLDPVIGCPDCADGGSEWVELTIGSRLKRVTFEYGTTINEIDDLVVVLRQLNNKLNE